MSIEFYLIAVVLTTIVSVSRLTRLATVDKFPPVKWLRDRYADATDGTGWQWLVFCGYCFSPWATLFIVAWGMMAHVYGHPPNNGYASVAFIAWWVFNGILAMSYLAAILMALDADTTEDDD